MARCWRPSAGRPSRTRRSASTRAWRGSSGSRARSARPSDRPAAVGVFALAGADYPSDVRLLQRGIERLGIAREVVVVNDTMAALRAGSRRPWGVALICGQGVNGAGVAPDGRVARFDGVGDISGDWGGGTSLGQAAQAAAVRARDGRGPRTSLEKLVPAHFGLASPGAVVRALYTGRVLRSASGSCRQSCSRPRFPGDAVAREIVDRLADELGVMATALIRRLRLGRLDPDVVLAAACSVPRIQRSTGDWPRRSRMRRRPLGSCAWRPRRCSGRRSSGSSGSPARQSPRAWPNSSRTTWPLSETAPRDD